MNDKFFPELARRLKREGISTGPVEKKRLPVLLDGQEVITSSQAPYPSLPRTRASSLISLLLLSPSNPLRWASMGPPRKRPPAFVGRGGARKRTPFSPQAETELSGLCPDEVLAGQELEQGWGYKFVTWARSPDRSAVAHGHYYDGGDTYEAAKLDFACRSGLVDEHRQFTDEQLAELYRCIVETLDSGYPITQEREKTLRSAMEQIESSVDDLEERVSLSNQRELEAAEQQADGGPGMGMAP